MRWDRFFEDIEDQLESEWEAERVALESEAERLRLSRLTLHERLSALVAAPGQDPVRPAIELAEGTVLTAPIAGVGADWILVSPWGARSGAALVPLGAIAGIALSHAEILRTARGAATSAVSRKATFGFAVRDVARRRAGVLIHTRTGGALSGTIDRAGADHLDVALHEPGEVRRYRSVRGYRVVPFAAIAWVDVRAPFPQAAGGATSTT